MNQFNSKNEIVSFLSRWNVEGTVWLFDYDLTLYGFEERGVLDSLDKGITQYVCNSMGLNVSEADKIRRKFWQSHGTTLAGLMHYNDTNPNDYFDFIHHFGEIIKPKNAPHKAQALINILGSKHVFTNARSDWAMSGLDSIGITGCFERVFDIECFDWKCKPQIEVYDFVEAELDLKGKNVIYLEDNAENLKPAMAKGWKTILLSEVPTQGNWDLNLPGLDEFFEILNTQQIFKSKSDND